MANNITFLYAFLYVDVLLAIFSISSNATIPYKWLFHSYHQRRRIRIMYKANLAGWGVPQSIHNQIQSAFDPYASLIPSTCHGYYPSSTTLSAPQQDPHDLAPLYYCHPFSTRFTTFIYMETSKPIDLMHICTTSLSVYIQKHDAIDIHMHQFDAFLDDGAIQTKYSLFELKMKPRRKAKETSKD
eukprot:111486_1